MSFFLQKSKFSGLKGAQLISKMVLGGQLPLQPLPPFGYAPVLDDMIFISLLPLK